MRRAAKTDANHKAIVDALRKAGCSVQDLSAVGKGCVDLLVGHKGVNYCIEIKDGTLPPSRKQLTEDQVEWHAKWKGHVRVAESVFDALQIVDAITADHRHG